MRPQQCAGVAVDTLRCCLVAAGRLQFGELFAFLRVGRIRLHDVGDLCPAAAVG